VKLLCFTSTAASAVRTIGVLAERPTAAELTLTFCLQGEIARIRVPPPALPQFAAELWQHTCFEAFVAIEGQSGYHEFNFAPSGEWAVYAFSDYRQGRTPRIDAHPTITVDITDSRLELKVILRLDTIAAEYCRVALQTGLSAVVEAIDGTRSYWAVSHPAERPDFHHRGSLTIRLGLPDPTR
jgi:hypothetical protein